MRVTPFAIWGAVAGLCACAAPAAVQPTLTVADAVGDQPVRQIGDGSTTTGADQVAAAPSDAKTEVGDAKADSKADGGGTSKTDAAVADSEFDNGITPPKVICGDSFCAQGQETCDSCESDCGPCTPVCGDGKCGTGESCSTCAKDCGGCAGECGNGYCDPTENCATCSGDCGKCAPGCGNGTCDKATETCDDCPIDCGKCSNEPCDPYTSKGCKDFEQCFPYSGGDLVCIGAGKLAKGQKCLPLVDCQKGLICINSICSTICDASGKQPQYGCPSGKQCLEVGAKGQVSAGVGACL